MYDYIVIGGGIVGVSTAWQLKQRLPEKQILLIEKEPSYAQHQTGHNSGVIHAGVYYQPGSLKADFCKRGAEATKAFCRQHNIAFEQCGKLIIATNQFELERMHALYQRCLANDISVQLLDEMQLKLAEPNVRGLGAILVEETAIVDYRIVTQIMAEEFIQLGGEVLLDTQVTKAQELEEEVQLTCVDAKGSQQLNCQFVIACCGLMADRVTQMMGIETDFQIIPYRGEYYRLSKRHNNVVHHLIYPVPDPELPFLGVHLTRMIDGSVTVGPNAVQGWKREGYKAFNFSLEDTVQMLLFAGFWKVTIKHLQTGLYEWRNSWWKKGYLSLVHKYCGDIGLEELEPYPAGIRAQAVMRDGTLVHDFLFKSSPRSLHVCNAPSPAATSAIPIGEYICQKIMGVAKPTE